MVSPPPPVEDLMVFSSFMYYGLQDSEDLSDWKNLVAINSIAMPDH